MMAMKFPIGVKIYGLATIILVILVTVALNNYWRMWQVTREVAIFADYTAPLKKHLASVNIYALEQQIHFERIRRLYEVQPVDNEQLFLEHQHLDKFGTLVDHELNRAVTLSEAAIPLSPTSASIVKFSRLKPLLQVLEEDHQEFQEQAMEIITLLHTGQSDAAQLLDAEFEEREAVFTNRLYMILLDLDQFALETAQIIEDHEQSLFMWNLWMTAFATLFGLTLALVLTLQLIKPIKQLVHGTQAVESGKLETQLVVRSGDEFETLAESFNAMLQVMRQKQALHEAFGRYVDPRIVETLVTQQADIRGRKELVTVLFLDLAQFSSISEMLTPARLVTLINQHLTLATAPIIETQGVIDKFIGDAIVAFWGPPFVAAANHAQLACRAALEQQAQLIKLQRLLPEIVGIRKGIPTLGVRIGLDSGTMVMGNIGTEHLQSYTVMGRTMEIAEQLEAANKRYGTQILLTERTRQLAGDAIEVREIDCLPIDERNGPIRVYELLAYGTELDASMAELRDSFSQGLQAYRQAEWLHARSFFENCLVVHENDGPSHYYLEQIRQATRGNHQSTIARSTSTRNDSQICNFNPV